jgi:hypothetical protein
MRATGCAFGNWLCDLRPHLCDGTETTSWGARRAKGNLVRSDSRCVRPRALPLRRHARAVSAHATRPCRLPSTHPLGVWACPTVTRWSTPLSDRPCHGGAGLLGLPGRWRDGHRSPRSRGLGRSPRYAVSLRCPDQSACGAAGRRARQAEGRKRGAGPARSRRACAAP